MWEVTDSFAVRDPRGLVRTAVEMTQVVEQHRLFRPARQVAELKDYMLSDGTPLEPGPNSTFVISDTREVLTKVNPSPRA